ncbi:hypothetical protein [Actinosynnema sp. NPDC020468]|uniref:hypothetical protein n=1 Tax=Actinosynnema sp. NPDC020468 TaxID=3154488 RepID=UPI0033F1BBAC
MAGRIAYGRVVVFGVLAGGLFGVGQALLHHDVWVGLVTGPGFGLVFAFALRRVAGSTALRGLDFRRRRAVSRALRRGVAVEDAALARPLVDQADSVLAVPYPVRTTRAVFAALGLLGLLIAVLGYLDRGVSGLWGAVPLVALSAVLVVVVLPLGVRQRERVRRSRDATAERHLS